MTDITYAELFAGAGGLSMGLELAGWRCVAHAEIEPHARAVLRKHWPDTRLDGDVTAINGADFAGVTLLSGGSPCQDLSIAGKRKGLGGERSGLFHEQVRIWRESGAPLFLWENVLGALSSNNGGDFGVVLSTIVGGAVPVPADGWGSAGVASGPAGVAAWRVLDGQYFGRGTLGTPQRRRRVFVLGVADGSVDPAEVLSLGESLSGHPAAGREAGEGVAADSGAGVAGAGRGVIQFTPGNLVRRAGPNPSMDGVAQTLGAYTQGDQAPHVVAGWDVVPTLDTGSASGSGQRPAVLTYDTRGNGDVSEQNRHGLGVGEDGDPSPTLTNMFVPAVLAYDDRNQAASITAHHTLRADGIGGRVSDAVLTYDTRGNGDGKVATTQYGDVSGTLTARGDGSPCADRGPNVVATAFNWQSGGDVRLGQSEERANTLQANQTQAVVLRNREGKPGGGKGPLLSAEREGTLGTANDQVVFTKQAYGQYADAPSVDATLGARDHAATNIDIAVGVGIPRRLTPLECERLMSWPEEEKTAILSVCFDKQRSLANAAIPNHKLPNVVGSAERSAAITLVSIVDGSFAASKALTGGSVLWSVEIDCETMSVSLVNLRTGKKSSAKCAGSGHEFARLVQDARIALWPASLSAIAESAAHLGMEASRQSANASTDQANGNSYVEQSGRVTGVSACDATNDQREAKCITSAATPSFQNCALSFQTLCYSAVDAICGFIREETSAESGFDFSLTIKRGHTAIGIDEKGREYTLSDTARYKLCGNGVLSACVAWIGMRLKAALDSRQAVV